jgi:hypothetical protein
MSTIAPDVDSHLDRMAALTGNPRGNFGSQADESHLTSGGYHCGGLDLRRINAVGNDDYSIRQPRDRAFYNWETGHGSNLASAIDYDDDWAKGGRAAWLRFNNMLRAQLGAKDPALAAIRGMNYSPNGTTKRRFDCLTGNETSTSDTVTWHTHVEWWRDTVGKAIRETGLARVEQIAVAAINNTALPPAKAAAPKTHLLEEHMQIVTVLNPPTGTKAINGNVLVDHSRGYVTPAGFWGLDDDNYGKFHGDTDYWNHSPEFTWPEIQGLCAALRQAPAALDPAQVKQAIQEALEALNADPGNEVSLSAAGLASVADAVATRIGQKLGTVQP